MRRKSLNPTYIALAACLFAWLSIPAKVADQMRAFTVATCAPTWDFTNQLHAYLADRPLFWTKKHPSDDKLARRLELENAMLRSQLEKLSQWVFSEERLEKRLEEFQELDTSTKPLLQRRAKHFASLIEAELIAMPCSVVYRSPSSWSSSLWVNIGEETNASIGAKVVAKNSPVLSGTAVVGVIDFVGKRQSRVRLVTDEHLCPSVRVARNGLYLAKGEIHGSGGPIWRSKAATLKGVGFNYAFEDECGACPEGVDLFQKGDLLVTTGFDGVFPPDLVVGTVRRIHPSKPGSFIYSMDVDPAASDLNDLKALYVIPSRN